MAGGFHSKAEILGVFDSEESAKDYLDNMEKYLDKPKVDGPHEVQVARY